MNLRHLIPLMMAIPVVISACRQPETPSPVQAPLITNAGIRVADTVIYDVLITNPDPQDTWTTKCLSRLNRKALIDSLFSMVYEGKAVAYNFETLEKLTTMQVRQMESADGFNRDEIGKIQFTEAWYINPVGKSMTKEVLSVVLGSNFYDSDGNLFGHKPVMRIVLK